MAFKLLTLEVLDNKILKVHHEQYTGWQILTWFATLQSEYVGHTIPYVVQSIFVCWFIRKKHRMISFSYSFCIFFQLQCLRRNAFPSYPKFINTKYVYFNHSFYRHCSNSKNISISLGKFAILQPHTSLAGTLSGYLLNRSLTPETISVNAVFRLVLL